MRSTSMILSIILLALLFSGCSGGSGDSVMPGADGLKSPLDGVRIINSELNDVRLNGESVISSAYINLTPDKQVFPLEIIAENPGEVNVEIANGLLVLPDGSRVDSYKGPITPLKVEPSIDRGLVELNVSYTGETEHIRRYWLAIDLANDMPVPPHVEAKAISPDGNVMDVARDEILVGLNPGAALEDFRNLLNVLDMQILEWIIDTPYYRVGITPGSDLFEAISMIEESSLVEYAEPNFIRYTHIIPNDTAWNQKWDLRIMDGPEGWDLYTGDPDIIVGVIDSGVDRDHPDLVDKVVDGEDFISGGDGLGGATPGDGQDNNGNNVIDENVGHGTHCSGIIGAMSNNSKGTTGVDWSCKIMGLRVFPIDGDSGCTLSSLTQALNYAKNTENLVCVNMSLGGSYYSQTEQNVINSTFAAGVIILASAGNSGYSNYGYPASYDNVISVAATTSSDKKASFSTYNDKVDVSAPGYNIYSTYFNNTYAYASGTSMSCPEATGLISLIRGYFPAYTTQEVVDQMVFTADYIYDKNPGYVGMLGTGRINIYRALSQPLRPEYTVIGIEYDDDFEGLTDGNNDGFFNPGETIEVRLTVRNSGIKDGDDPIGLLEIDDPYVHVIKGEIDFPDIPKTSFKKSNEMFLISIDYDCPDGHEVSYTLDFDDAEHTGPHETEGEWVIYKDEYSFDSLWLEPEDMPEGNRIFKGIDNQALIRVDVSGDVNYGTIDELTLYKFGTVATEAISEVRLYHDTDGDGVFDADGNDLQLATEGYYNQGYVGHWDDLMDPFSGHPNGPITAPHDPATFNGESQVYFRDIYLPATNEKTNSFFVVIDLDIDAVSGSTLQVGIMNESNIMCRVPDAVDPECLPVLSGEFIVCSTWETDKQITLGDSDHSWRPEGATNSEGDIFIVIDDDRGGNFNIYLKKSTSHGTIFNPDKPLTTESSNEFYPSIAIDSSDVIHVVYYTTEFGSSNREIMYLRSATNGTTWDDAVRLTNAYGDSRVPDIAIGPDDTVHVAWFDDRTTGEGFYYKQSVDGGDNWSSDLKIANNPYYNEWPPPCIEVGNNGTIHVVWEKWVVSGPYLIGFDVYYCKSETDGASFEPMVNLTPGSGGWDYAVRLAVDPAGNPYAVYHHATSSSYDIYCKYSIDGGDAFLLKNLTNDISTPTVRPDIFINDDGFIDIVFKDNIGVN